MSVSSFNPYQAPAATSDDAALAPDTEFLFNDKVVAGTDRIVLPRICIATGATKLLVEQEKLLSWCSRWITTGRSISILATMFCAIPMLTHLPPTPAGISSWSEVEAMLQMTVSAGIIIALIAFIAASYVFNKSIHVRWYVSERVVRRHVIQRAVGMLVPIVVAMAILVSGHWAMSGLVIMILVGLGFAMRTSLIRPTTPVVVGTLDGLFLIGGLSKEFLAETQRLVDAYDTKDK